MLELGADLGLFDEPRKRCGLAHHRVEDGLEGHGAAQGRRLIAHPGGHRAVVVGADGIPAVAPLSVATMNDALRFDRLSMEQIGDDILEVLAIRARPA